MRQIVSEGVTVEGFGPATDGVDHVNVYSRGRTAAGRLLSNFARTPFVLHGVRFESVEGFYHSMLVEDEALRLEIAALWGREAKAWGKKSGKRPGASVRLWDGRVAPFHGEEFMEEFERAVRAKCEQNEEVRQALLSTGTLPLTHYYVMFGRPVHPRGETGRFAACLTALRREFAKPSGPEA
jgi:predicted NAD-dependent protein-ADP-ribosyltransferase YbiA (DUF1768 family)